eukprot:Gb_22917 [translate_table: standard]
MRYSHRHYNRWKQMPRSLCEM